MVFKKKYNVHQIEEWLNGNHKLTMEQLGKKLGTTRQGITKWLKYNTDRIDVYLNGNLVRIILVEKEKK